MQGELTSYTYDQEAEMVAARQEDYDKGRVYFVYDETAGFWRKVETP
jgi:hypothetical protein